MKLTYKKYRDKLLGCWNGKNIGGILGAPFEGLRQINDVSYYTQKSEEFPPPNDDVDLQIVWLNAVERYGRAINSSILGEYWLSYIIPDWAEYGAAKNNLRGGIMPPISGYTENGFSESNGCFIRSELWACLAPGNPELAARYAYEDGSVDHSGEGLYAEIFCAAVESAAFVESDKYKLIEIGLSYIPQDCGIVKGINTAMEAYRSGKTWKEARMDVLREVPGTFGIQRTPIKDIPDDGLPTDNPGYDAPSSMGIVILSWLYGEDDFGKSLCIAVNCGEDTDCTSATVGAILGIIHGNSELPEKWLNPINGVIKTLCINQTNGGLSVPKNTTELVDRICRLLPAFLGNSCDILSETDKYEINVLTGEDLFCPKGNTYIPNTCQAGDGKLKINELIKCSPYTQIFNFPAFTVELDYVDGPYIQVGVPKKLKVTVYDNLQLHGNNNQWMTLKWYTTDNVTVAPQKETNFFMKVVYNAKNIMEFEITVCEPTGKVNLLGDISICGRHSYGIIKASLIPTIK